jgi:uncharacterized protein DUF4395
MKKYFYFGEKIDKYSVRVLNEREVRAGAGILFLFAVTSFQIAWFTGNLDPTKIFVVAFMIDFFIRIFINPKYAPSLILGRLAVSNQKVEYVGAPQKRFAWGIGFILATTMFYSMVLNNIVSPISAIICSVCLIFLFFESVFGICIGCRIYNLFNKEKAKLCPGGTCEIRKKEEIQKFSITQVIIVILFAVSMFFIPSFIHSRGTHENCGKSEEIYIPSCPFTK